MLHLKPLLEGALFKPLLRSRTAPLYTRLLLRLVPRSLPIPVRGSFIPGFLSGKGAGLPSEVQSRGFLSRGVISRASSWTLTEILLMIEVTVQVRLLLARRIMKLGQLPRQILGSLWIPLRGSLDIFPFYPTKLSSLRQPSMDGTWITELP